MYGVDMGAPECDKTAYYVSEAPSADDFDGFIIGDIVTLVTGSPDMVVLDVCDCGSVDVAFYDEDGMQILTLPEEALAYAE